MKWYVFALALLSIYPLGMLLRQSPRLRNAAWIAVGIIPFTVLGFLDINFLSHEHYRGDSRGIEITILDLLALSLLIALPRNPEPSPYRLPRYLYLGIAVFSTTQAIEPLFSWFSIWKILRMYLLLAVLSRASSDRTVPPAILTGLAIGLICQGAMSLFQRYVIGDYQTTGLFAHQNSLGMSINLAAPIFLGLLLSGSRSWLPALAVLASSISIVLSLSRGAIAVHVLVMSLTFLVSVVRLPTPRKLRIAAVAAVAALTVLARAGDTLIQRFTHAPAASASSREVMEEVALEMLKDSPLGVGINQYSLASSRDGYWRRVTERHGMRTSGSEGDGIVHNIYWLTAAELGYAGLAAFLFLLLVPLYHSTVASFRALRIADAEILVSIAIAQLGLHAHGILEWAFRTTSCSYLFWLSVGLSTILARQNTHLLRTHA